MLARQFLLPSVFLIFLYFLTSLFLPQNEEPPPSSGAWNMVSQFVGPDLLAPTKELVSLGAVNPNFCVENANLLTRMGMMNEVTKRALVLRPGARYLSNAKYQHKGPACIEVSGMAMK